LPDNQNLLSLIFPVYFNEGSLPELFEALSKFEENLEAHNTQLELIFIDDGSKDNSFQRLLDFKKIRPATKLIKLTRNFGAVAATKTGFKYVTGDCFAIVAADLQDPIEKVLEMHLKWMEGAKYVVCRRLSRNDPIVSRLFSGLYYYTVRVLIASDYPSGGFDLMLMDKAMLPYIRDSSKNINTHLYAHWLGFSPTILEYHRPERSHGKSRWTFIKKFKLAIDTITGFSVAPIRIVSAFGFLIAIVSFIFGITIILGSVFGEGSVAGFTTIVTLISFFGGMTLFMLGILGEYLWRIFDNSSTKPESVIDETFL
jgi:dolichol-phosphate mannosyltransferase